MSWFHAIDFGDAQSPGRAPEAPPNWTLFGCFHYLADIDVRGQRCLDIGTMDGLIAFILSRRGAREVIATDLYDREPFRFARTLLGLDGEVAYHPHTHINQMSERFGSFGFDLVAFCGVLYHAFAPLVTLMQCRQLLKEGGLIIVDTSAAPGPEPTLLFNMEWASPLFPEYTTYFVPTKSALEGMMKFAGFEVLGCVTLRDRNRITALGRATRPSQVPDRTALMREGHERLARSRGDLMTDVMSFYDLEHSERERSSIRYAGRSPITDIDIFEFETGLPLQPLNRAKRPPIARRLLSLARRVLRRVCKRP